MEKELRNKLIKRARENGAKFGKKAELDFGAGAEWMYDELLQNQTTPTPDDRGELKCPECNSDNIKTAIYTKYKECNECYHYWEANQPQTKQSK